MRWSSTTPNGRRRIDCRAVADKVRAVKPEGWVVRGILASTSYSSAVLFLCGQKTAFLETHAFELAPPYAIAPHLPGECETETGRIPYTAAFQKRREELQERLEEFANNQFGSVPHTARIEDGDPATVIEWIAQQEGAGIVIMPTTGHGRFRRLLFGSVTAKVLHDIPCPILTSAHQPDTALGAIGGFHSVLCAVEMNSEAHEILEAGGFLARTYSAGLCLVHIESASSNSNELQDAAQPVKRSFQKAPSDYSCAGVKTSVRVLDASAPEWIRRRLRKERTCWWWAADA